MRRLLICTALQLSVIVAVGRPHVQARTVASPPPLVTRFYLSSKSRVVENFRVGTNINQYQIDVYGVGFDSSSQVVIDGNRMDTVFLGRYQLIAAISGIKLKPGVLLFTVVNGDGQASNVETIDVVSHKSIPVLTSGSSVSGSTGSQVTLTGSGFVPRRNRVTFARVANPHEQMTGGVLDSADGTTLALAIPQTAAGQYRIFVSNSKGSSNSLGFLVVSPGEPIGVWGGNDTMMTVTDYGVMIQGVCFQGLTLTPMTVDTAGNFNVSGFFAFVSGPSRARAWFQRNSPGP